MDPIAGGARRLEEGRFSGPLAGLLARGWARVSAASLRRPLAWRRGARVILVGGATLGGSGKTPLAVACVRALARAGVPAALVGHAYGARPCGPRVVEPDDDPRVVGDEALASARALSGVARVVVARRRQEALDLALALGDVAVVDGVLQAFPERAALSLLAVDGQSPWGAGACPPSGDLRAPVAALTSACDAVVSNLLPPGIGARRFLRATPVAEGAHIGARRLTWADLRSRNVGLWTSVARPDRILSHLARQGVEPRRVLAHADHAFPTRRALAEAARAVEELRLDAWLCTAKCHAALDGALGPRVAVLDHALRLEPALEHALCGAAGGAEMAL